jgi:hypothetical protein
VIKKLIVTILLIPSLCFATHIQNMLKSVVAKKNASGASYSYAGFPNTAGVPDAAGTWADEGSNADRKYARTTSGISGTPDSIRFYIRTKPASASNRWYVCIYEGGTRKGYADANTEIQAATSNSWTDWVTLTNTASFTTATIYFGLCADAPGATNYIGKDTDATSGTDTRDVDTTAWSGVPPATGITWDGGESNQGLGVILRYTP